MFRFSLLFIVLFSSSVPAQPDSVRFAVFGDYGVDNINEQAVADLVNTWNPDFIITTGDNSYLSNPIDDNIGKYYSNYIADYTGVYGTGSVTNRFFPCLGNHDYTDGFGEPAYLDYFTLPGAGVSSSNSSGKEHYYDFIWGPVHFFAINSNAQESDGIISTSVQAQWLQNQLALSSAIWKIVYLHHPPYSSAITHGSNPTMQWPYEDWDVTAVFTGHDHTYERIIRDDNNDNIDIPYFVTGLGGRTAYSFPGSGFVSGSMVRYNSFNGSMLVDATIEHIIFKFYSVDGGINGTLIDSFLINNTSVSVNDSNNIVLPDAFSLRQNYPNPFNSSTVIEYTVPFRSQVTISIYNILGQKIINIVDDEKEVGSYTVMWDSKDDKGIPATTGIYLYRMTAGNTFQTNKMLLLK